MLDAIQSYYDQDQRLNAPVMGAIYARVMEQVNKVASLLALEAEEVQPEHVGYARPVARVLKILPVTAKGRSTKQC